MNTNRGIALIFVLWILVLLTGIAFGMAYRGHLRTRVNIATGENTAAFYLARAGVEAAIAELANTVEPDTEQIMPWDNPDEAYVNVELGTGTYTLYAGIDENREPKYGMIDEAAKINLNTADAETLARLPNLTEALAGAIVSFREQQPLRDVDDLLALEGFDPQVLHGEDHNRNGLLDSNENDGDLSWPQDNQDGVLDEGLAQLLTTWSASRNMSRTGVTRVNLNSASAEAIVAAIPEINQQQADSIVAKRESSQFESVLDLMDVDLVEKVAEENRNQGDQQQQDQNQNPNQPNPPQPQPNTNQNNRGNQQQQPPPNNQNNAQQNNGNQNQGDQQNQQNQQGEEQQPPQEPSTTYRSTGQKAFDTSTVRNLADRFTTADDEIQPGLINVNTAPYDVLLCLPGMDESLANAVVVERQSRPDGFASVADLLDVDGMNNAQLKRIYNLVTTRSDVFRVRSFGVIGPSQTYASISAVIDRSKDDLFIRDWQEHE